MVTLPSTFSRCAPFCPHRNRLHAHPAPSVQKSTIPERIFLASRLLFLSTVSLMSAGDFIKSLVEAKPPGHAANIMEIIGGKLDVLTRGILTGTRFAREAMTDLLKFTFNLLLHYPKVSRARMRLWILPLTASLSVGRRI